MGWDSTKVLGWEESSLQQGAANTAVCKPPLVKHKMPGGGRDGVWLLVESSPLFLGFLSSLPLIWGLSRAR